jgi:hypothetical protein
MTLSGISFKQYTAAIVNADLICEEVLSTALHNARSARLAPPDRGVILEVDRESIQIAGVRGGSRSAERVRGTLCSRSTGRIAG